MTSSIKISTTVEFLNGSEETMVSSVNLESDGESIRNRTASDFVRGTPVGIPLGTAGHMYEYTITLDTSILPTSEERLYDELYKAKVANKSIKEELNKLKDVNSRLALTQSYLKKCQERNEVPDKVTVSYLLSGG